MFEKFKLWKEKKRLWWFHRHEWCMVSVFKGRSVLLNPGCKKAAWGNQYRETWRHPQTGFVVKRTMVG